MYAAAQEAKKELEGEQSPSNPASEPTSPPKPHSEPTSPSNEPEKQIVKKSEEQIAKDNTSGVQE